MEDIRIRRLTVGDEHVVERLATRTPRTALLGDERSIFLVAFDADVPVGFVLAYELLRRHGDATMVLVYEVDVDPIHQRRRIATRLLHELERIARERGIGEGFVLADLDNEAANALYGSLGGARRNIVEWDFEYTAD